MGNSVGNLPRLHIEKYPSLQGGHLGLRTRVFTNKTDDGGKFYWAYGGLFPPGGTPRARPTFCMNGLIAADRTLSPTYMKEPDCTRIWLSIARLSRKDW